MMEMELLDKRIERLLSELKSLIVERRCAVSGMEIAHRTRSLHDDTLGSWLPFANGGEWGGAERWWDFRFTANAPEGFTGKQLFLEVTTGCEGGWDATNPQFEVFVDGELRQAIDTNHTTVLLGEGMEAARSYSIYLKGYCQTEAGQRARLSVSTAEVASSVQQLYYDVRVPLEAAALLPRDSRPRLMALAAMSDAMNCLDLRDPHSEAFYASVDEARQCMQREYYEKLCDNEPEVIANCVGHTHIDVAWLWDLEQTRHKAVRSFSTVLELMRRYPEYKFMSSQPVLYKLVKEDAPQIYEQIKQRIREGRWECEGGMWLEADCNLAGGEALVRQLLHGKEFFRKEFGVDNRILWLPDVFGYSAALPQILKKSGIDYFMTTKLSWSEYNKTPYDTFKWKGMDGSEVLTHFIPTRDLLGDQHHSLSHYTTYNGDITPMQIAGGWNRFQQKGLDNQFLVSYGFGDGGGGPTDKMLEYQRRMEHQMPGMPKTRQSTARQFFEELDERVSGDRRLPKWSGELYLEYHRGTYTAVAKNKRNNRKIEIELRETELWCSLAARLGHEYPEKVLHDIWECALTLQFHDILPGSSIKKVYDDSDKIYAGCFAKLRELKEAALAAISAQAAGDVVAFNSLSERRDDVLWLDAPDGVTALRDAEGNEYPVQRTLRGCCAAVRGIPAMGAKSFDFVRGEASGEVMDVTECGFDTPFFRGEFDEAGRIASLTDKRNGREVAKAPLNRIVCYENKPHNYDAWDINIYYSEHSWDVDDLRSFKVIANGPVLAIVRAEYAYQHSTIAQDIIIYKTLPRIDFNTDVDWKEKQYMLKAHFPVDVFYNAATYDVQYGNVTRATHKNTSWDVARFEACHHKWMDVSEAGYGVSVLNDCKYGCSVDENSMALTLLKSSTHPDPDADQCMHRFTYSLMPHVGTWREGGTVREAYSLNMPLTAHAAGNGDLYATGDEFAIAEPGVMVEAVKQQLDGNGTIVRMYEYNGARTEATLHLGKAAAHAYLTDLMENVERELPIVDGGIKLTFKPYEILTVLLEG